MLFEIEATDIQLFILVPMLIKDDYYQILDPDELADQAYIKTITAGDPAIRPRAIVDYYQPLFITDDFKAIFRPSGLDLTHVNAEQSVQAILPGVNLVVKLKWRYEIMCNLTLLVLELQMPAFTSLGQINDLLEIVQTDIFTWHGDMGWLIPHHSMTDMLDIVEEEAIGLSRLTSAFAGLLQTSPVVKSQNPFVALLLQMNLRGGNNFYKASDALGEYVLAQRFSHLSSLLGYHENQPSYTGPDWRYAQKLDSAAWFDWQPPQHRDTPLVQYRRGAGSLFTSSIDHRRAARRIFKICTQEYVAANLLAQLLASQGEGRQIRSAIQSYCRSQGRDNALYFDLLTKLNRLEARMLLLGTNIANPEWVLDNPLGEGEHFIELMRHISDRFSTASHVQALRQQLDLFNMMLDRCR